MQHKKQPRTHQATLTDQEARILNFFRTNNAAEIHDDLISLFEMVVFDSDAISECKGYRDKLYGVWDLIKAIDPPSALGRQELDNDPENLHI